MTCAAQSRKHQSRDYYMREQCLKNVCLLSHFSTNHFCTWQTAKVRLMVLPVQGGWEVAAIIKVFHDQSLNTPAYSYNCLQHSSFSPTTQNILKPSPKTFCHDTHPQSQISRFYVTILYSSCPDGDLPVLKMSNLKIRLSSNPLP